MTPDQRKEVERLARLLHSAPSRALRNALSQYPDGRDHSDKRNIDVLYAELTKMHQDVLDAAVKLFDLVGLGAIADEVDEGVDELLAVLDAARVAERICNRCGCTEFNACPAGCTWAEKDLCSRCVDRGPKKRGRHDHRPPPRPRR
ncbi:MAG: hypothetical protein ACREU5_06835 [Burkholderiales bacterium]